MPVREIRGHSSLLSLLVSLDSPIISEEIQDAASVWLSRRDRGLTASEQDAYLEWLYRDPLHGRAIVQLERVWSSLNQLEQWRPAHSAIPNPDLLAPRRPSRLYWWATTLAAAAAIALGLFLGLPGRNGDPDTSRRQAVIHPGPEKMTLADGSIVELNQGAKLDVQFTPQERHVRLLTGEAHFTVAHNAERPFFVDTGKVSVRAVGTAFTVSMGSSEIAVLVTEGKVQVIRAAPPGGVDPVDPVPTTLLSANQRVVVALLNDGSAPVVQEMTPAEMERASSWQAMRLEFVDMPLGDVVAEFNRYNRQQLSVADGETAAILVAGNFRADNVDAFVRLLESDAFGVTAFRHGGEITLRRTR